MGFKNCPWTDRKEWDTGKGERGKGGGGCMIGDDWVLLFLCTSTPQRD